MDQIDGRDDIVIDLSQPGQLESLKDKPFIIKEGTTFRMVVRFKVQHHILSGMKYIQVVKRMGISSKSQEMIVCLCHMFRTRCLRWSIRDRIARARKKNRSTRRSVSVFYHGGMS